jgi:hypothetical protein
MSAQVDYKEIFEIILSQKLNKLRELASKDRTAVSVSSLVKYTIDNKRADELLSALSPIVKTHKDGMVIWKDQDGQYSVATQERGGQFYKQQSKDLEEALTYFFDMVLTGTHFLPPDSAS